MIRVREEKPDDAAAIERINREAFGRAGEAQLVAALREAGAVTLSLVALVQNQAAGHILFSPVTLASGDQHVAAVALGPMAVLPDYQRQGIGSALVHHGLDRLRRRGESLVFVLGHPTYYPRFGFRPAASFGIDSQFDVPPDVFMVAELRDGGLKGRTGTVTYRPEFANV